MKILIAAAALLLILSGCASQEAPAPVALQTQESATAEASPAEPGEMDEPEEAEPTEPASEATSEPTSESTAEATVEPTTQASTQAQQTAEASPSPIATATATPTPTPTPTPTRTPSPTPTETVVAGFTMADVRMNNTASSCWVAVDGRVFDLTQWITRHPGGAGAISQLCGTDGTASFTSRHGGQARPTATLESYDIGPLR